MIPPSSQGRAPLGHGQPEQRNYKFIGRAITKRCFDAGQRSIGGVRAF
jgi:hypothetical protein